MEHRLFKRTNVEIDAFIYQYKKRVARGKIRNLSQDGIFVEITYQTYPVQGYVEVMFYIDKKHRADEQCMPAIVAHHSNHGIGLMFSTVSDEAQQNIDKLLHKKNPRNKHISNRLF